MSMTSNIDEIRKKTGISDIGRVYIGDKDYSPCERYDNDNIRVKSGRIYDIKSCNFHLFPEIEKTPNCIDDEIVDQCKKCLVYTKNIRERMIIKLSESMESCKKQITVYNDNGKSGSLFGIPKGYSDKGINGFFRYIVIEIDAQSYAINFNRFYIDKENKVNCKLGELQFYSFPTKKNNKGKININDGKNIYYPKSYKGQNEKMIRFEDVNMSLAYNPCGFNSIYKEKTDDDITKIIDEFISFINKLEVIKNKSV